MDSHVSLVILDIRETGPRQPPREIHSWDDVAVVSLAAHGGTLLVQHVGSSAAVDVGELDASGTRLTSPLRPITADAREAFLLDVHGEDEIAFLSHRSGVPKVRVKRANEPDDRLVSSADRGSDRGGAYLANGDLLVLRSGEGSDEGVCTLARTSHGDLNDQRELRRWDATPNPSGGSPRCHSTVRCAAKSAACALIEGHQYKAVVRSMDAETGALSDDSVSAELSEDFALSPDGATVASIGASDVVELKNRSTGATRTIHVTPAAALQSLAFSPDGRRLILTGMSAAAGNFVLLSSDLEGHGSVLFASDSSWMTTPRLSASGRRVFVTVRPYDSNAFVLTPER
jgi:WD40 repeat protein